MPKIHIRYNKLLDPVFYGYHKDDSRLEGWKKPSPTAVIKIAERYQQMWNMEEKRILYRIKQYFKMTFCRSLYDVHVVSFTARACSNPLVISSHYKKREFLETLTHELIHVLLKENNYPFEKLDTSKSVLTHIPVYKGLRYIFGRIKEPVGPEYLEAYHLAMQS